MGGAISQVRAKKHLGYFFFHFSLSSWSDASIAKLLQLRSEMNISISFQGVHKLWNNVKSFSHFCVKEVSVKSKIAFRRAATSSEQPSQEKNWACINRNGNGAKNLFSNLIDFRSRCSCAAGHEKKYKPACRWFHSQNRARQEKTQEMEMANLIYGVLGQNFRRESARQVEGDRNDMTCSPACPKISRESFLRPESQG